MASVVVVGLGPAGADHLTAAARAALANATVRYVRTARHPAVDDLAAAGIAFESFDAVYDGAADLDDVYARIADELVSAAARHGEVVYAVPGHPTTAERSVALLRRRAGAGDIALTVVAGVSFADLAWARVGVDPLGGGRVLDAGALDPADLEVGGPVLVAQVDSPLVASDVKLALLERLGPDAPVTVLQRLGLGDERVEAVRLADLDRVVAPDHLTSLFVDLPAGAGDTFATLVTLGRRLRGPGGCPWDAEQNHRSLTRYLLEEAYEVVDAIEALPPVTGPDDEAFAALADELGDLLFQVVFHAVLAEEAGAFTSADVVQGIHDKLVRRHPHVFGDVAVASAGDVVRNWEQIKKDERASTSLVDSVPTGLPALLYTHKLFRKAASIGLAAPDPEDAVERAREALDALDALDARRAREGAGSVGAVAAGVAPDVAVGQVLGAVVQLAGGAGIDAESALRGWAGRYRARFARMEELAAARGVDLHEADAATVSALWARAAGDAS